MSTPPTPPPAVNHPPHYGGDTTYEAIKVIEAWNLDFCLGNTVKYISRAGKKGTDKEVEDLLKAKWYLERRLTQLGHKEAKAPPPPLCSAMSPDCQWMYRIDCDTWVDIRTHESFALFIDEWRARLHRGPTLSNPPATKVTLLFDVPVDLVELTDMVKNFCTKWSEHRGFLLRPTLTQVNKSERVTEVLAQCTVHSSSSPSKES